MTSSQKPSVASDIDDRLQLKVEDSFERRVPASNGILQRLPSTSDASCTNGGKGRGREGLVRESSTMTTTASATTYSSQGDLPRLPIPSLEETMQRLVDQLRALQSPKEQEETRRIVEGFLASDGPRLQQMLLDYDQNGKETGLVGSYVESFWSDAYLVPDSSVVLNLNPYFVLEDGPDPKLAKDQLLRAASLTFSSLKFVSALRCETLRPDTFKGKPLDMDQFRFLFATARVPSIDSKDTIHCYENSNHVAVMCLGQMYYFQALWKSGDVAVDESDIHEILTAIQAHAHSMSEMEASRQAFGVLTSLNRREWAKAREATISHDRANMDYFQIIDSALFVLALDDFAPANIDEAAANMLHGSYRIAKGDNEYKDYQVGSCCNRYYDKLQIIVCSDGTAGVNFEHSAIDGHTALRFVSDVYADTVIAFAQSITSMVQAHDNIPSVVGAQVRRAVCFLDSKGKVMLDVLPKQINLNLPEDVQAQIRYAEAALGDEISACDTKVLEFKDWGKKFIVNNKLSPDSLVQMSIILAYFSLYGRIVQAYEPVLTKMFYHGRTEAMRPTTTIARDLCKAWSRSASTKAEKLSLLRDACMNHSRLVKACACGQGVDRHLYALKCIAEQNGEFETEFFNSVPWKLLNHTVLSTSNCGNPSLRQFGFGPVVSDGFGVGYIIRENGIHFAVASRHRQTARYINALKLTLTEIGGLLDPSGSGLQRSLKDLSSLKISYDSYGDIWGENDVCSIGKESQNARGDNAPKTTVGLNPALDSSKRSPLFAGLKRRESLEYIELSIKGESLPLQDSPGVPFERQESFFGY